MYGVNSDFQRRDVAIYARVSTDHEAQVSALGNQVDWYKPILAARPEWTLCAQYIDEGITGTSAEKRPQFMKMIKDARAQKFNMIITREVSRFARNTVDTLQYTRLLKDLGVEVFFINDNIKTFDGDGELRLTIMATLAQDESRKTSMRVKAGQQTSMNNGVFYGNGNILGYDRVGREMVINPEQAKTVRMIYDMYLSGMGVTAIQYELEKAGRLTATGKEKWFASYISHMLKNSFYCGIITYHKEYTPDYLKQKKIVNYGDVELTQVKGTHTPIVTEEEFYQVQEIMAQKTHQPAGKRKGTGRVGLKPHGTVWGRLMICKCGKKFNQRFDKRSDRDGAVAYQCYTSVNIGSKNERIKRGLSLKHTCDSPYVSSWKLELMASKIFKEYIQDADKIANLATEMIKAHISDQEDVPDNSTVIEKKAAEVERLNQKRKNLIEMRAEGDIDREYFREKKQEIEKRIAKLSAEIERLTVAEVKKPEVDDEARLHNLRALLAQYTDFDAHVIPECVVEAFIERIWVSKDEFRWYLRTGSGKRSGAEEFENRIKIAAFAIGLEEAKAYQYSVSTRKRIHKWFDLNVSIWV